MRISLHRCSRYCIKNITRETPAGRATSGVRTTDARDALFALSRDPKYLPHLRKLSEHANEEWGYRRILQALRGMSGTEARALRLEINKRMRNAGR